MYRIDNAGSGTVGAGLTPVKIGSFPKPGAITARGGTLYVAQIASGTTNPAVSGMVVLLTTKPIQ